MIVLTTVDRALAISVSPTASVNLPVVVGFTDVREQNQSQNAGVQLTEADGIIDQIICDAPEEGVIRNVDYITVLNPVLNGQTTTVSIHYDENGIQYTMMEVELLVGDILLYEDT